MGFLSPVQDSIFVIIEHIDFGLNQMPREDVRQRTIGIDFFDFGRPEQLRGCFCRGGFAICAEPSSGWVFCGAGHVIGMAVLSNPFHFKITNQSDPFVIQFNPSGGVSERDADSFEERSIFICRTSHDSGTCGSVSHFRLSLEILSKFREHIVSQWPQFFKPPDRSTRTAL